MQRRKLCVALRFDAFYEDKKMRTTHVVVKPYDKKWKMDFEDIKKEIQSAIGDLILGIEHVGSTSVEGLQQNHALIWISLSKIIRSLRMLSEDYRPLAISMKETLESKTGRRFVIWISRICRRTTCMYARKIPKNCTGISHFESFLGIIRQK